MTHQHSASAGLGVVLAVSLLGTSVPAGAADPTVAHETAAATSAASGVPSADGVPTTLTFHGGRDHQELGQRLQQQACDLDDDGLGDLTAGSAVMYGSTSHADMPAYRRAVAGHADSSIDLPHWWSWTTSPASGWSCAGDTNGDGFDDVVQVPATSSRVVGLNLSTDVRTSAGRLQENRVANYQFPAGATALARTAAGAAGDVDGDGLGDVVVSRHTASSHGRTGNGQLWVLAGQEGPTVPAAVATIQVSETTAAAQVPLLVVGAANGDGLASALPVGDVNGDGLDDLAVAAPGSGQVWLVHGRASGEQVRVVDLADLDPADGRLWVRAATGPAGAGLALGAALTMLDDVDGDGVRDLGVGAAGGLDADGGVAVVRGGEAGTVVVDPVAGTVTGEQGPQGYWIRGERAGDGFGHAVAGIGDVDGDGRGDLLVGAPGYDPAGPTGTLDGAGAAYVLHGRGGDTTQSVAGLTPADGHRIDGSRGEAQAADRPSRFGAQVAALGDVDGNGATDFAVSAPGRSEHATSRQGGVVVALRGELGTDLGLVASRRRGDGGEPVADGATVRVTDRIDLRASLRLSTLQGVPGEVAFEVDGRAPEGCAAVGAEVRAPHRSHALCETGLTLDSPGQHVLAARHAGEPGRTTGSQSPTTTVYATDTATTTLRRGGSATADGLVALVRATASGAVSGGEVTFETVDATGAASTIAGCAAVPVIEGRAGCDTAGDLGGLQVRAGHSGVTVDNAVRPGEQVEVIAPSTSGVLRADELRGEEPVAREVGLSLSRAQVRHGDRVRATAVVTPGTAAEVELRVDGRRVGTTAVVDGTATLALPRTLAVGRHEVVAALAADETYAAATSPAVALRVAKAVVGRVQVTAPRFVRGTRPRLTVTVGPLSNGAQPVGTVRVTAAGRTTTAALTTARRGRVTVTLPRRHRAALAVRVAFVPTDTTTVATPRTVTTRLRPRG